jgi:NAD(P)-dependent dehydrogenase (short-subunit alcohol dehydrogenase family)
MDRFGRIDGLQQRRPRRTARAARREPTKDIERVLGVNLFGTFFGMKHVLPFMKNQGAGMIVNNSSVVGARGFATRSAYVASKRGIVGLTRTTGVEYGEYGISVICLICRALKAHPGPAAATGRSEEMMLRHRAP